jgi:uncharacterized protein
MIIDISDLTSKKVTEKEINTSFNCTDFSYDEEYIKFVKPVILKGKFRAVEELIVFQGDIQACMELTCSRCLEKFQYSLNVDFHEEFTKDEFNEDEEIFFFENSEIDFLKIIENNIILNLPIKKLCKTDCKGLCPSCGEDLNKSSCSCIKDDIDPRFIKLKDFFSK